jgi:hypothetical protein
MLTGDCFEVVRKPQVSAACIFDKAVRIVAVMR